MALIVTILGWLFGIVLIVADLLCCASSVFVGWQNARLCDRLPSFRDEEWMGGAIGLSLIAAGSLLIHFT